MDPQNDIQASKEALALGLASRTALAGERGDDFEETLENLRAEQAIAKEMGVSIEGLKPAQAGAPPAPATNGDGKNGKATDGPMAPDGSPKNRLLHLEPLHG